MYALERTAESEAPRPRKVHDKTCRVRFTLNIPPGLGARNSMERDSAMARLHFVIKRHFGGFGAENIGFFRARDERTGRSPSTLTGFVNHPRTISRKEFIVAAFKYIKFFNAGMGELAKVMLSRDDLAAAPLQDPKAWPKAWSWVWLWAKPW